MSSLHKRSSATDRSVIANAFIRDARLSYTARGLFLHLWCMPDNKAPLDAVIMPTATEDAAVIRAAIIELVRYGYLCMTDDGMLCWFNQHPSGAAL